jgi:hypothetical protein
MQILQAACRWFEAVPIMLLRRRARCRSRATATLSSRTWQWRAAALGALLAVFAAPADAQQRLHAEITRHHPKIYVAPLPDVFNYRVLTDYDVKR